MVKNSTRTASIKGLILVAAIALPLAGCTEWHPSETDRGGSVDFVQLDHRVQFEEGATTLTSVERGRIDFFLDGVDLGFGDTVTVALADDALGHNRAELVLAHLTGRNIKARVTPVADVPEPGSVAVAVGRYVVTPPRCPDWTKAAGQDLYNTQSSNLGCANSYNLSVMVANPVDLLGGRRVDPGDGAALALGVERYRTGQVTPLATGETSTTGSE